MEQAFIPDVLPEFFLCYPQTRIPSAFLKFFNRDTPMISMLEGLAGRSWQVAVEQIERDFFFNRGWPHFMKENNLEYGDFVTFCYAGNSKFYVKIYGKDGCLKQDHDNGHAPPPADQTANQSGNFVVPITSFELVMKKSYLTCLTIPSVVGNRLMRKRESLKKFATLRTGSSSWRIGVCSGDRLAFRNGLRKFMRDNDLCVGDVCRFELIDEEQFILEVSIRRFSR